MSQPPSIELPDNPLGHLFYETMVATILRFTPPQGTRPAKPQPDDYKRIMDHRMIFDEPGIQAVISSLPKDCRMHLEEERADYHALFPLLPPHFRIWDPAAENYGLAYGQYLCQFVENPLNICARRNSYIRANHLVKVHSLCFPTPSSQGSQTCEAEGKN
jgi:hypothetical protein